MEFNLSEKSLKWLKDPMLKGGMMGRTFIDERDVKEFIKLLKEDMHTPQKYACICCDTWNKAIDKLAGDKLS